MLASARKIRDYEASAYWIVIGSIFIAASLQHAAIGLAAVLVSIGFLVLINKEHAALSALIVLTPFETFLSVPFSLTKAAKILLMLLVIGSITYECLARSRDENRRDPYAPILFAMLVIGLIASIFAASPARSSLGLVTVGLFTAYYMLLVRWPKLVDNAPAMLNLLIIVSVPVAILTLLQMVLGYSGILGSAEQKALDAQGTFNTLWPSIVRASGTFGSNNAAAAFFGIITLITLNRVFVFPKRRKLFVLLSLLALSAVLATFSRGAILGLLIAAAYASYMFTKSRWQFWVLPGTVALILFVFVSPQALMGYFRLGSDVASASLSRIGAWEAASTLIAAHPVTGIGFYAFQGESAKFENTEDTPTHPHNGLLKASVEEGIFGGLAYFLFAATFMRVSWRTARASAAGTPMQRWIVACAGSAGILLYSQELVDAGLTIGSSSIAVLFATLLAMQVVTASDLAAMTARKNVL